MDEIQRSKIIKVSLPQEFLRIKIALLGESKINNLRNGW